MRMIWVGAFLFAMSASAFAGDAENITACIKKAKDLAGVTLDPFSAEYEGNIFLMSIAKWDNTFCEVKFGSVYNLQINGSLVVYKEFSGKESYDLNEELQAKTEKAISQLNGRIVPLRQRAEQVTVSLKQSDPNRQWLTQYIDESIEKAVGRAQ